MTGRKTSLSCRSSSVQSHRRSSTVQIDQVKENQLQWMFNRRKTLLEKTSAENIQMYLRIRAQKSELGKVLNKKASRPNSRNRFRPINNKENM